MEKLKRYSEEDVRKLFPPQVADSVIKAFYEANEEASKADPYAYIPMYVFVEIAIACHKEYCR